MPPTAPLDYSPVLRPAPRLVLRPWVQRALFGLWLSILVVDVCVQALPAFGPFYSGSPMSVPASWGYTRSVVPILAMLTIIPGWSLLMRGWMPRLTRTMSLALGIYHLFLSPGQTHYGHLLWGYC